MRYDSKPKIVKYIHDLSLHYIYLVTEWIV